MIDTQTTTSFRQELRRFFENRLHDGHLAEDLTHDVLLKALTSLDAGESPRDLRAWLFQIARRTLVDAYRKQGRRLGMAAAPGAEMDGDAAVTEMDPGDPRVIQELASCLDVLLDALPDVHRKTLIATDLEGRTHRDAAAQAGISLPAMKSRVLRARAALRRALLDCCSVELDGRGVPIDYRRRRRHSTSQSGGCSPDCRTTTC